MNMIKIESGSILPLTIFTILFVALLSYSVHFVILSDLEIATSFKKEVQALYCAESGIEAAIFRLRVEPWSVNAGGSDPIPAGAYYVCSNSRSWEDGFSGNCTIGSSYASGTFSVLVTSSDLWNTQDSGNLYKFKKIVSTGYVNGYQKQVEAVVKVSGSPLPVDFASNTYCMNFCGVTVRSWVER